MPASRLEVARARGTVLVRVVGLGSVNNAPFLWEFAMNTLAEGFVRFAFDLAECRGMDSTFLGTLAGIAQEAAGRGGEEGWVCAFNVSDSNRELIKLIGVDRYVRVKACMAMEPIETEPLASGAVSQERLIKLVRRAHERLVNIDKRNEARFGDFLRMLAEELDRKG